MTGYGEAHENQVGEETEVIANLKARREALQNKMALQVRKLAYDNT